MQGRQPKAPCPAQCHRDELLQEAAGQQDLSAWARDVLSYSGGTQLAKGKAAPVAPGKKKAARPRPQCTCGATANPNGVCDGAVLCGFDEVPLCRQGQSALAGHLFPNEAADLLELGRAG